jgi:DNA-binding NarL/FixJ family response regulator
MAETSALTSREQQILRQILKGKTNREIARALAISEKTVQYHLDRIYNKTGARTRLLAGIWALQHGIALETREIPG